MVKSQTPINARLTVWLVALVLTCTTVLSACSSSNGDKSPADVDPGSAPTMPGNLSASVHSSYKIELNWTPSIDDGLVMGYEIIRDGVVIEEQLAENTFTDTMLEPATTYHYSVIAVDNDGNRSNPSNVEATTLDGPPLPAVITVDNHVELLRHVFDIYTGNAYRNDILTLPNWSDSAYSGVPPTGPADLPDEANISCLNGGTATFTPFRDYTPGSTFPDGPLGWDFTLSDCQDDDVVLDGNLHREYFSVASDHTVTSAGLTIEGQLRELYYKGEALFSPEGRHAPFESWEMTEVEFIDKGSLATFSLTQANSKFTHIVPSQSAEISGGFTIQSSATNGHSMSATLVDSIGVDFSESGEFNREYGSLFHSWRHVGTLELSADDGSKLVLKADNSDEYSVTIEISTDEGISETLNQPSDLWAENLFMDFDSRIFWNSGEQ